MRKFLLSSTTAILVGSSAFAGGLSPVIVETEPVIVEKPTSSLSPLVVLGILLLVGFAVSQNDDGDGGVAESDIRLKTDIKQVGMTPHGLPLYQFRYIGLPQVYEGVMAQDVLKIMPEAVVTRPTGTLAVNYGMLGLKMKTVH